ncbi:hypothetical protein FRC17_007065, partial [Serendipita sp. 399]
MAAVVAGALDGAARGSQAKPPPFGTTVFCVVVDIDPARGLFRERVSGWALWFRGTSPTPPP